MVTYTSKTFVRILVALLILLICVSIVSIAEGSKGSALATILHGAILYGLARRKEWVIRAIRFWAVLLLIIGGFFLVMLFSQVEDQSTKLVVAALAFGFIAVGSFYFESTPKYLVQEPEDPSSNQGEKNSTVLW